LIVPWIIFKCKRYYFRSRRSGISDQRSAIGH